MFKFLGKKLRELFKGKVDEEAIEKLEELFFEADLGTAKSHELADKVRELYRKNPSLSTEDILREIKKDLCQELTSLPEPPFQENSKPLVILIVGVNGNGKTTSIAKLAHYYRNQGKKVLIAAADTFRAAAVDQLEKWAKNWMSQSLKGLLEATPLPLCLMPLKRQKHVATMLFLSIRQADFILKRI